ncbi:hypothetical protein DFJ58DRAFT_733305 [Suillus subalutaceus]|uniref:uncharacterized protein n=1 Tax=Suillus subalutaceus TaxID=48586 RepID=UPI001B87C64E|nr:uncharacterized protein DFJ58DRAFT_733305 [Suillus subalutaceus]KAG1839438.1 hypothetical protein DFJ58DRAFT_733305 [Suillus subalutaceus]
MAVPLPTDELHNPIYDLLGPDCFQLANWGGPDTYLLSDKHNYDDYIVYYSQLCDPDFDIVPWLTNLKLRNYSDLIIMKSSFRPTWFSRAIPDRMVHSRGDLYEDIYDSSSNSGCREINCKYCDDKWVTTDNKGRDMVITDPEVDLPSPQFEVINNDEDVPGLLSCKSSDEEGPVKTGELFCKMANHSKADLPDLCALQHQAAQPKSSVWVLPKSIIVVILLNGKPC